MAEEETKEPKKTPRDKELSKLKAYAEDLDKIAKAVEKGFIDQQKRTQMQMDYWDVYDCELNGNQNYSGISETYLPFVHDAIEARVTRFTNQVFPSNQRYIEVITEDGEPPYAEMALAESYIRNAKMRTEVIPATLRNGDVEGQYNLYCTWSSSARHVTEREVDESLPGHEMDSFTDEVILDEYPVIEVLADCDVMVWPQTANSIREALHKGGGVAITRRWSKDQIERLARHGDIVKDLSESITAEMTAQATGKGKNMEKKHVDATGIKSKGKFYLAREVWHTLKVDGERRITRSYFGESDETNALLGTKLNPFWCDKVPVFSAPLTKIGGSFKGKSKVSNGVDTLQYAANDVINQAFDSATLSLNPIVGVNAESVPKNASLMLAPGAVWERDKPDDIQFMQFPKLYEIGLEISAAIKAQIQQSLGVNPSMIPMSSAGGKSKKPSQSEIANEQAVDVLTTSDVVSVLEESILTPLIEFMVELDMQFRDEEALVPTYGMMGHKAKMERIPPFQRGKRYEYRWLGVEQARNAARIQQQTAAINVLRGMPPQMLPGKKLDLSPVAEALVEAAFGPRIAPKILIDEKDMLSMDPEIENEMLSNGFSVPTSPMDDDIKHIQAHMPLANADPHGVVRVHIMHHQTQMQAKAEQAKQQQNPGAPGTPGGGPPGIAGQPRPGAQPMAPRGGQQPPGAIHSDQMAAAGSPQPQRKA